jgi:ABC-type uncharacterized transport system permease subunit
MASQIILSVLVSLSTILFFIGGTLRVKADKIVTGMVFCDQCKDGQRSFLDYPLYGTFSFVFFTSSQAYLYSLKIK